MALREYTMVDLEAVHVFASDPRVCGFAEWGPDSRAETRVFLESCVAEQHEDPPRRTRTLAITVAGRVRGSMSSLPGDPELAPDSDSAAMGYVVAADCWGKGYASEAAAALLDHAGKARGIRRVAATCRPENAGSIRVLERTGMRRVGHVPGHKLIGGIPRNSPLLAIDLDPGI